jgi:hypothetical protein
MEALTEAVHENIPNTKEGWKKCLPGWKNIVAPYKEDADFWQAVWISAGKPQNTELHRVAKYTKTVTTAPSVTSRNMNRRLENPISFPLV